MIAKYLCSSKFGRIRSQAVNWLLVSLIFILEIEAQTPSVKNSPQNPPGVTIWSYLVLFIIFSGLAILLIWLFKARDGSGTLVREYQRPTEKTKPAERAVAVAEKETIAGSQKTSENSRPKQTAEKTSLTIKPVNHQTAAREKILRDSETNFKQNLENLQSVPPPPVFGLTQIALAQPFSPLDHSVDPALLTAIEQVQDEFEEDREVREVAVRILAAFKTRNAIEALAQVALYDLSSSLRVKAVNVLADFDHESVFETVLLACADPTREVRAAAARGLFRLSFDRADAWKRIAETNDVYRMRQSISAATEADLIPRSFERLIHADRKIAYEAVNLLALMVQAGETDPIFDFLKNHPDENVKLAILHVLDLVDDERTAGRLTELLDHPRLSAALKKRAGELVERFELIPA